MTFDTPEQRKLKMLTPLQEVCHNCTMCELGFKRAVRDDKIKKPQVFSTMTPTRFMVVGQNPGWNEVVRKEPFVGDAGAAFDAEVAKHGLSRQDFYICNAVKCFTEGNTRPLPQHMDACEPYLRMEVQILKPKLVIALGSVAFEQLCPGVAFTAALGKITKSAKYGVPVFPIYHPSPLNLDEGGKRAAFEKQIELVCGLVKALRAKK